MNRQLAYLDHNVLDHMCKSDPDGVCTLLQNTPLTPVFSQETLLEIHRSSGHEEEFLAQLKKIGAQYLVPILDEQFRCSGKAEVRVVDPFAEYRSYIDNVVPMSKHGFGLSGMLEKFYGGRQGQSFEDILSSGANELDELLRQAVEGLAELDEHDRLLLQKALAISSDAASKQCKSLSALLDADVNTVAAVKQFENFTGLGPKILNNVQPPGVLSKIWALLEPKISGGQIDLETFLGIKPDENTGREKTILEKVNAVYHQLNFVGCHRDSKMHQGRRFVAAFSDMTHAGLASFCHLLVSRDENLVIKSAAAYEYLGVQTQILHVGSDNSMRLTRGDARG